MRTFIEALKEAKLKKYLVVSLIITVSNAVANALILVYIADIFNKPETAVDSIIKVILSCLVTFVCPIVGSFNEYYITHKTYRRLLDKYITKVSTSDYALFTKYSSGHILSVGTTSLKETCRLPAEIIQMFINIVRFIVTTVTMITISPNIGIGVVIIFSIPTVLISHYLKQWWKYDTKMDEIRHIRTSKIEQMVSGFAEIKTFRTVAKRSAQEVTDLNTEYEHARVGRTKVDACITTVINSADTFVMLLVIVMSLAYIQDNTMLPATAITLITFAWRLVDPLYSIINWAGQISMDAAPLKKIQEFMDFENTISDGQHVTTKFNHRITFSNVGFSYPDAPNDTVLENVTFTVERGQKIGICGPSGGGKTSLLKLIPRFYDVTQGKIFIDDWDIKDIKRESLQNMMGIVHQDPYIFDTTIGLNIKFVRPNYEASEKELVEACTKAGIYDFITSLPNGFDTNVGPRGLKLSGGQKQRIALARIFLQDPDIIILDEATSALDNETERIVQDSINNMGDKTLIVIAHRLSTIKNSDKIIVIDDHTVAESGTHEELLSVGGKYAKMVKLALNEARNNY